MGLPTCSFKIIYRESDIMNLLDKYYRNDHIETVFLFISAWLRNCFCYLHLYWNICSAENLAFQAIFCGKSHSIKSSLYVLHSD